MVIDHTFASYYITYMKETSDEQKQFKVLVVDDDTGILDLSTSILRRAGYEVLEVSTGEECLDAVRIYHPDLVLLDVRLPDMSGIEVCRQIKSDDSLEDIFVILASGIQISSEDQAEGLDIGQIAI